MNTIATNEHAYILNVNYGDKNIGTLSSDKNTNLLKLQYNEYWQRNGFAISPSLPVSNLHSAITSELPVIIIQLCHLIPFNVTTE